jgi:formate-dependent nitrite reductase membrane component NrfD
MWSEQGEGVRSGHPGDWSKSSAAALLSYDIPHKAPWDWRVALYTWTKAIGAGGYMVALLLVLTGFLEWSSDLFMWAAPLLGLGFLGLTGAILVWDLEHPNRFYYLFTRPQWRSWLVKGAMFILGYGAVLAAHLLSAWTGSESLRQLLAIPGLPLALMSGVYTAYLFAHSRARDLWQSPLLPPHMVVQAMLAGSGALLVIDSLTAAEAGPFLAWTLALASMIHLLFLWGEVTLPHGTAHAHLAVWEMTSGRYSAFFWSGIILSVFGLAAPWAGAWVAFPALAGLLAYEHANIQSAQAVPLA